MLIRLNKRFKAIFEKFIKAIPSTYSAYSGYSGYGGTTSYGDCEHVVYFYEFSEMGKPGIRFESIKSFLEFIEKCNLTITNEQLEVIEKNKWCYSSCVPNRNILMVTEKYMELKDKLDRMRREPSECTSLAFSISR